MAPAVSANRTHAKPATPVSVVTFAYSDVVDDDHFDATRSPTASDKVQLISLRIFLGRPSLSEINGHVVDRDSLLVDVFVKFIAF